MARSVWQVKRITNDEDAETGLRVVKLPTVKGLSAATRDAIFAFEREHLGTTRAVIRMNKRAEGRDPDERTDGTVQQPYRLSQALASASDEIRALYA